MINFSAPSSSQKGTPCFFYLLNTQYENLGDRIINRECLSLLREYGSVRVTASGAPLAFLAGLNLAAEEYCTSSRNFYRELWHAMRSRKGPVYLVLVPGGISGGMNLSRWPKDIATIALYAAMRLVGIRIIRLGASYGPFSPARLIFERWKSRFMAHLGLRDHISLDYARRHRIAHVTRFPDFAFMLPVRTHEPQADNPYIVVSFRADTPEELEDITAGIKNIIARLDPLKKHHLVLSAQVERDEKICAALKDRLKDERECRIVMSSISEENFFDLYRKATLVLSNRLHVLLFSASCSTPILALTHSQRNKKIIGLFQDYGLENRLIYLDNPSSPSTIDQQSTEMDTRIFAQAKNDISACLDKII